MDIGLAALADTVIGRIWPDKTEAEKQQLAAAVQLVQGQLEINKVEAASPSVFVSGWRPFIGWVCGLACAWNWIGLPILRMYVPDLTPANLTEMMPVLMGLLGLGALRTVEKINNVASR
jgi:hypothetical protein